MNNQVGVDINAEKETVSFYDIARGGIVEMTWDFVEEITTKIEIEKEAVKLKKLLSEMKDDEDADLKVTYTTGQVFKRVIEKEIQERRLLAAKGLNDSITDEKC